MATADLPITSIISTTGSWIGATVANLESSNDARATGGVKNDTIKAEVANAPGDFGSQNSVALKIEARVSGATSRDRQVQIDLLDGADVVLQTFTTPVLTTADQTFTSTAFTRADSQAVIDGYRLLLTVIEGGGMADTEFVEIDYAVPVLDYNLAAGFTPETNAFRIYNDDAGEAASTPLGAQDTDVTVSVAGGDAAIQLRLRVDETGGGAGASTDDWQIEVSKNAGAYANITDRTHNVRSATYAGWNLGDATAVEATLDVSADLDQALNHVRFGDNGNLIFYSDVGLGNEFLLRRPLSTPYDIAGAGASDQTLDLGNISLTGFTFKPDGLKLYLVIDAVEIRQHALTAAWDLTTFNATPEATVAIGARHDLVFKPDGTKAYIGLHLGDRIDQFPLTTAWDISTMGAAEANLDVSGEETDIWGVALKEDGSKVYYTGRDSDTIHQRSLSTPWSLGSAGAVESSLDVSLDTGSPNGVEFGGNGNALLYTGLDNATIFQRALRGAGQSSLTDGAATTNRATNGISDPGAGTFVSGVQEAFDGLIADHQLTADNFTEHVFALTLVAADLADTDTLDFRLLLNGTPIAATVTPRVTVTTVATDDLLAADLQGATEVTQPALAQIHALGASDIAGASEVTQPALAQDHQLGAADLDAASELTQPALTETAQLAAQDLEAAATLGQPAIGQAHTLDAADLAAAGETTQPALGQAHALDAADLAAAAELTQPVLAESNALAAADLEAAATVGQPVLAESNALAATDLEAAGTVGQPALGQAHALDAADLAAVAETTQPALGQAHALDAADLAAVAETTQPALGQVYALDAADLAAAAELTQPVLAESNALAATDLEAAATLGQPALAQAHALSAAAIEASPTLGQPALAQVHVLAGEDLAAAAVVTRAVLTQNHALTPADLVVSAEITAAVLAELLAPTGIERFELAIQPLERVTIEAGTERFGLAIKPVERITLEVA